MNKFFSIISIALLLVFAGCANDGAVRYEGKSYKEIKQVLVGDVIEMRNVYVEDDGSGKILGAIIGAVLGSTVGKGDGKTLAVLGGAIIGGAAGDKVNEKNAQELTVNLDNGDVIVVISKGTTLLVGDRVRIIKDGNEVAAVKRVSNY